MADGEAVSIVAVIPLYNGGLFIEQAIRSVFAQTWRPDECIVVDDGSSDDGPDVVTKLAGQFAVRLLRKPNGGQSSARNYGVAHSTSTLIAFLDQDDAWYPDHLAKLLAPFVDRAGDRTLGWVYADLDKGDEAGQLLTHNVLRTRAAKHPKTSVADCLKDDMFVLPSTALVARHAFEAIGGYENDDLFVRLLDRGFDNVFIDKALSLWRIYAFSTTYSPRMGRSRMIFARKAFESFGARLDGNGRPLATSAIAPRFTKALFGEYARAGRRRDGVAMDAALDDLRDLMVPHLPAPAAVATRAWWRPPAIIRSGDWPPRGASASRGASSGGPSITGPPRCRLRPTKRAGEPDRAPDARHGTLPPVILAGVVVFHPDPDHLRALVANLRTQAAGVVLFLNSPLPEDLRRHLATASDVSLIEASLNLASASA